MTVPPPPGPAKLEPTACIGAGWRAFQRRPGLAIAPLMPIVAMALVDWIPTIGTALGFVLGAALNGGIARLTVRLVEDRDPRGGDLLAGFRRFVALVFAQGLYYLMLVGVLAPVILPIALAGDLEDPHTLVLAVMGSLLSLPLLPVVVFLALRFSFTPYLLMDSARVGLLDAFARSWMMTRRSFWRLVGLVVLTGLLQVLGMLALVIGLLVTIPVAMLAWAAAYVRLRPADLVEPRVSLVPEVAPPPLLEPPPLEPPPPPLPAS